MNDRFQLRIQRYGWDLAVQAYREFWQSQFAWLQATLLESAQLAPGEQVLDVACGPGLIAMAAARAVGQSGSVTGVDLSDNMVESSRMLAREQGLANTRFTRMDAQALDLPSAGFDVVFCSLGLMYVPDPAQALREMRRVLRPGGRLIVAVWGERARCGWSALFPIVDDEVASEVCPHFFQLGGRDTLATLTAAEKFEIDASLRMPTTLCYANDAEACDAAFVGGPVALAWSRFDAATRARVQERYIDAISGWRTGGGYSIPAEFVIVCATALNE